MGWIPGKIVTPMWILKGLGDPRKNNDKHSRISREVSGKKSNKKRRLAKLSKVSRDDYEAVDNFNFELFNALNRMY